MKPTLLIVDDEKPTREGLRAALEERYDVYLAEDAATAMGLLEAEHFDVLLTDFRLPSEDGMKLIARAKSLPRPPVCILMTAYGSEEVAVQAVAILASHAGARATIAHVSTPGVAALVASARKTGADLVAEVCPQYLYLREDEVFTEGALRKFTPPARIRDDLEEFSRAPPEC